MKTSLPSGRRLLKLTAAISALALAPCLAFLARAADEKLVFVGPSLEISRPVIERGPLHFVLKCGIQVNIETGEVKIPEGIKLDEASRKFWIGLAESMPGVRDAWVSGYLASRR